MADPVDGLVEKWRGVALPCVATKAQMQVGHFTLNSEQAAALDLFENMQRQAAIDVLRAVEANLLNKINYMPMEDADRQALDEAFEWIKRLEAGGREPERT